MYVYSTVLEIFRFLEERDPSSKVKTPAHPVTLRRHCIQQCFCRDALIFYSHVPFLFPLLFFVLLTSDNFSLSLCVGAFSTSQRFLFSSRKWDLKTRTFYSSIYHHFNPFSFTFRTVRSPFYFYHPNQSIYHSTHLVAFFPIFCFLTRFIEHAVSNSDLE